MRSQCFRMALIVVLVFLLGFAPQAAGNSLEVSSVVENNVQDFPSSWIEGRHELEVSPSVELQDVEPPSRSKHPFTEEGSPFGLSVPLDEERWRAPRNPREMEDASIKIQNSGGPDDFGYTWDDTAPFNWIDAKALGINTGITGDDETGLVDIGFSFPFYEQTWSQVYVSTNGLLLFGVDDPTYGWGDSFPSTNFPNNLIAPFWDDLVVGGTSAIYAWRGGTIPNRYCVVEWYRVVPYMAYTSYTTFEVILYENGDILMQYQDVNSDLWPLIGIEDSLGWDGLEYDSSIEANRAIRFDRPPSFARVNLYPLHQGSFVQAGEYKSFAIPIRNTGTLGTDTYDIWVSSPWSFFLFAPGGGLLTDTDGDSIEDTGPVAQGQTVTVTVAVGTPPDAEIGDYNGVEFHVISSREPSQEKMSLLRSAVPAPFVQAFEDEGNGAMSLYLVQPSAQEVKKATENWYYGDDPAIVETLDGDFVYTWNNWRCYENWCNSEIEYILLDRYGETSLGVVRLTNHAAAEMETVDSSPAVAAMPNGYIGLLWQRQLYNEGNGQYNTNIYLAILDNFGNLVYGPANLTNNTLWGSWDALSVPSFSSPVIAATADNRFALAWEYSRQESAGSVVDIYLTIRDAIGGVVKGITNLTNDTPASTATFIDPALASLSQNRVFISWDRRQDQDDDLHYMIVDSGGNIIKNSTNLSQDETVVDWRNYDAVQLSNGNILVAWEAWGCFSDEWSSAIRIALLDASYDRIGFPSCLGADAADSGDSEVSVTADSFAHGILTWTDRDWSSRHYLYYALVDSSGTVVTWPMTFLSSQSPGATFEIGYRGYGNTSYRWVAPVGVDGMVRFATSFYGSGPAGIANIGVDYANHGTNVATNVVLTATLGSGLTYVSDNSGFVPMIGGHNVVWGLPALEFLDYKRFALQVRLPDALYGTRYPMTLTMASVGPEVNSVDNKDFATVMIARQLYLPLTLKQF